MLIEKLKTTIRRHHMLSPGDRVVVAVSGGPDSVCLLHALRKLSPDLDITLHVAHLDHRFRGKESEQDALFVKSLAESLSLQATIETFDVPAYCREQGLARQAGAREVRYDFLERTAKSTGASRIATAHTADDQAETLLMRLLRGAGTTGLSGIPPVRGNIIRPLIDITRREVLDYLEKNSLASVTDSSNLKPAYTRNRIRLELLPVLRTFNPRISETLATASALLRDEDEALRAMLDSLLPTLCSMDRDMAVVERERFNALHRALRRRLLKKAVALAGGDASVLSATQIEAALNFVADAQSGRVMQLQHGLDLEREYDRILVRRERAAERLSCDIPVPGLTAIPELGIEIAATRGGSGPATDSVQNYPWQATFDYDKISAPLRVRNRHPGDRFCPAGMRGKHKKLKDYLIDEKVPQRQRDRVPLLCAGEDILWVVGFRTDERFLAGEDSTRTLVVVVKRITDDRE